MTEYLSDDPKKAVSDMYPREVIKIGQYLGAQLENDHFFPPWKIQKLYEAGLFQANEIGDEWHVSVELPDGRKKDIKTPIVLS